MTTSTPRRALLDTTVVIDFPVVLIAEVGDEVALSAVTIGELHHDVSGDGGERRRRARGRCSVRAAVTCFAAPARHAMLSQVSESFLQMLAGGHPNSLGRTQEVVDLVLADQARLSELFATITSDDEVVRLRVGDALEKVCREQPAWLLPHVDLVLGDLGEIDQPSVQWHVAQMAQHLHADLSSNQARNATRLLQRNLSDSSDWIVLNVTMDVLSDWARHDRQLAEWLEPQLERLRHDTRRSVATRAVQRLAELVDQVSDRHAVVEPLPNL